MEYSDYDSEYNGITVVAIGIICFTLVIFLGAGSFIGMMISNWLYGALIGTAIWGVFWVCVFIFCRYID